MACCTSMPLAASRARSWRGRRPRPSASLWSAKPQTTPIPTTRRSSTSRTSPAPTPPAASCSSCWSTQSVSHRPRSATSYSPTPSRACRPTAHPVRARQRDHCRPWLARLIDDAAPRIVVSLGVKPLEALRAIEPHNLRVRDAGTAVPWYGRHLLPLYPPSRLGQVSRSADLQRRDIAALRAFIHGP